MKLETVKSFILIVLIGISIILSYTLWSYQPNSNQTIGGEIADNEMNAGGRDDLKKRELIKPSDIIFHMEQDHYGFSDARDRDSLFAEMQNWIVSDFEMYSDVSESIERSPQAIELIFPEEIPLEVLDSIFTFSLNDDDMEPSGSMERVMISFIADSKSLQLEFISPEMDQLAVALVNDAKTYEYMVEKIADLQKSELTEYLVINEDINPVYFPAGKMDLQKYSITPTEINPSLFVNILFTNPSVVRETRSQTIGQTYFTDNRQMNVYQDGMRMEYISHVTPTTDGFNRISEEGLLDQSIANINSHSGWTQAERLNQEYRLEEIDSDSNKVSFQMYYHGYPVFNNLGLDTIEQVWGVNQNNLQLIEYNRPLFKFDNQFFPRTVDDFQSGEFILSYLESNEDISMEDIQDVTIGYELKYQRDDEASEYIEMVPAWYKKENNIWQKLYITDEKIPRGGN